MSGEWALSGNIPRSHGTFDSMSWVGGKNHQVLNECVLYGEIGGVEVR